MTQHIHEELEVGQHLDQATRETLIGISQLVERLQRSAAERDRAAAQAIRDSMSVGRTSRARMRRHIEDVLGVDADEVLPATENQTSYLRDVGLLLEDAELTVNEASAILTSYETHKLSQGDRDGAAQLLDSLRSEGPSPVKEGRSGHSEEERATSPSQDTPQGAEQPPEMPATANQTAYLRGIGLLLEDAELTASEASAILTSYGAHELTKGDREGAAQLLENLRSTSPSPVEERLADDVEEERATSPSQETEQRAATVLPAYRGNTDRGVSPSKAGSPEEAQHRRQGWTLARAVWEAEHPELTTAGDRQAAWDTLPMQEKTDRYWAQYDTEEARTVTSHGSQGRARREAAQREAENERTPAAATPERGYSPAKASNSAEAEHRRTAWRIAEQEFVQEKVQSGVTSAEALAAWRGLDWPDKALRYWTAYDSSSNATAPNASGPPNSSESVGAVTRERVIELNGQAAEFFSSQAGPGSKGHAYFTDRLGSDSLATLTGTPTSSGHGWQVGYAPAQWTALTDHLRLRGASDDELVGAGLARTSSRGGVIDAFRDRAMIAIRDTEGMTVGFVGRDLSGHVQAPKYVNTGETPAFRKGDHLVGLAEAPEGARIVRVEGPFDALAISAAGDGRYAGVAPLGTALTGVQADRIAERAIDGRTWIALDGDKAGRKAAEHDWWEMRRRDVDVRMIPLDDGADPASVWRDTPAQLRSHLATAESAPTAGFVALDNALQSNAEALGAADQKALEDLAWTRDEIARGLSTNDVKELDRRAEQELDRLAPQDMGTEVSTQADAAATGTPTNRYNRGSTTEQLTDQEAAAARQISGLGFSRSTEQMLAEAQQTKAGRRARPQRNPQSGLHGGRRQSL